jgi:hypothetical protein
VKNVFEREVGENISYASYFFAQYSHDLRRRREPPPQKICTVIPKLMILERR